MPSCVRVWSAALRRRRSLARPAQTELSPVESPCVCVWEGGKARKEGRGVCAHVGGERCDVSMWEGVMCACGSEGETKEKEGEAQCS